MIRIILIAPAPNVIGHARQAFSYKELMLNCERKINCLKTCNSLAISDVALLHDTFNSMFWKGNDRTGLSCKWV